MKKTAHWGFDTKDMDTKVRPQDDFFHYAGGAWLKKNPIPKEESRWGRFMQLRKDTDTILHGILKSIAIKRGKLSEREQQLRDFFRSGMDMKTRNKRGTAPLEPWRKLIRSIKTSRDLVRVIGRFERAGIGGPWGFGIDQDMKNSKRYMVYLFQSGLGMPDRDYYLKDDAESKRIRTAYVNYMRRMKQPVETILNIETKLAEASMTKEDLRNPDNIYHKYKGAALGKLAAGIDWNLYFKETGMKVPKDLCVMQPKFIKTVERLFTEIPIKDWQKYLEWHLLAGASSYLTAKLEKEAFLYSVALSGAKHMQPQWRRVLGAVNAQLGELLGEIYIKEYFTPDAKRRMNDLVANLFAAFERRIKELDWMSPTTKKKALHKLAKINHKIGYPSKWKSYKGLIIRPNDYAGNALRASEYEHMRQIRRLGEPIDRTEWGMYPQTVNAYYSPVMNEIVFPAGILQPPFFSTEADDAINYGSIGSIIGHEISHAFDDEGSKFDAMGNLKSWWTADDRKRFMKKAQKLVEQFGTYEVVGGIRVNGQLTLGENIADLGGIAIAYEAYQRHLAKTERKDIGGFTPEQRYFIGVVLFELGAARPEFEKLHTLTNPHSPEIYRVNGPVSNLPEFYAAWGVNKGDKLYREPKDRAKIW